MQFLGVRVSEVSTPTVAVETTSESNEIFKSSNEIEPLNNRIIRPLAVDVKPVTEHLTRTTRVENFTSSYEDGDSGYETEVELDDLSIAPKNETKCMY